MDFRDILSDNTFMADVLTVAQRSYNMSRIRSKNTGPEIQLRNLLRAAGITNFSNNTKGIAGTPDFYFPERKLAVFVNGCFWHGCRVCYKAPSTNQVFWKTKIGANILRDRTVTAELRNQNIQVIRISQHELKKKPQIFMKQIKNTLGVSEFPRVLDLFAGAGGFSEGFVAAGCNMIAHIEMDNDACQTIRTRMIYHSLRRMGRLDEYEAYLRGTIEMKDLIEKYNLQDEYNSVIRAKIGRDNYQDLIKEVRGRLKGESLDLIIGGPPCQAYSNIGRGSDRKHMQNDERNYLYRYYIEFLKALKPKMFIFENVPGLESAGGGVYLRTMRMLMKRAGYVTDYRILNASDFGVPQERRRIILIGWKKNLDIKNYPDFQVIERKYLVRDFLKGLPSLKPGEGKLWQKYNSSPALLVTLGIINPEIGVLTDHVARPHAKRDLEIYKLALLKKAKGENIRYNKLPSRLKTHKNQEGFLDRFKVVDGSARACHTVIAHIAKDGHYYIHPDILQNRSLTVREAARIQTFPDDFKFEGSRTSQFKQIGNAVPPMLSAVIAEKILNLIYG